MATADFAGPAAHLRDATLDIALVDDSPLMLDGLEQALGNGGGMNVVLRGGTSDGVVDDVRAAAPNVVIMDPWTPLADGPAIIGDLHRMDPAMTIVALSSVVRPDHVQHVLSQGASAYLGKDVASRDLVSLIRQVRNGATIHPPVPGSGLGNNLTERELEVLRLVAQGMSNHQVGDHLFVTEQTVKFHLRNINRKLGASNRTEAVHLAKRTGLIG